jgi:hypothetical protein
MKGAYRRIGVWAYGRVGVKGACGVHYGRARNPARRAAAASLWRALPIGLTDPRPGRDVGFA